MPPAVVRSHRDDHVAGHLMFAWRCNRCAPLLDLVPLIVSLLMLREIYSDGVGRT